MKLKLKPTKTKATPVKKTMNVLGKFKALSKAACAALEERSEVVSVVLLAVLTKQHVLLHGKHGTAKSMLGRIIFSAFEGDLFETMFTRQMTEDVLFGIPNIKKMQSDGVIEFNTEGMLPEARWAFLEEMFDGNEAVLRSTLDILNERQFRKGATSKQCPLWTAIATTNFVEETPGMAAVLDRFLYQVEVTPLTSDQAQLRMAQQYLRGSASKEVPKITMDELESAHEQVCEVDVPDAVLTTALGLVRAFGRECGSMFISDRRKCWCLRTLQATAWLRGSDTVDMTDLNALPFAVGTTGCAAHVKAWDKLYAPFLAAQSAMPALEEDITLVRESLKEIRTRWQNKKLGAAEAAKRCIQAVSVLQQLSVDSSAPFEGVRNTVAALIEEGNKLKDTITQNA